MKKRNNYPESKVRAVKAVQSRISEMVFYRDRTPRGHYLRKNYSSQISSQRSLLRSIEADNIPKEQLDRIQ